MNKVTSKELKGAFILGTKRLLSQKEEINELNVFPVPDGDTGTNMYMTVESALGEISNMDDDVEPKVLCKAISQGALRGARGNSGVILSQLFRGFYKVIKLEDEISLYILAQAFQKATETAYRAVMNPKEGTILTVAKAISERARDLCDEVDDVGAFYDDLVSCAKDMLDKTPELLPVLKEAGVVDSGGTGLLAIMQGAADYINGRDTDLSADSQAKVSDVSDSVEYSYNLSLNAIAENAIGSKDSSDLKMYLENIGKIKDFEVNGATINFTILSNEPGKAITRTLKLAAIQNIDFKNLNPINDKTLIPEKDVQSLPPKEMGFVAVSVGDGINDIFMQLGCDTTIKGGQTMNPSTEDIVEAVLKVNAKNVFVLPNNKNILLAAQQASSLCVEKNVVVIPTTTIPQGITALLNYIPENSVEDNATSMKDSLSLIKSGEVTHSIRDTSIDGQDIKEGDFIGIGDGHILSSEGDINDSVEKLVEGMVDDDSFLLSVYYGEDVSLEDAKALTARLSEKFPSLEIDLQMGGQPVYNYILSIE